jgi:myo-inositol-1(or 4)-monophosphatase
MASWDVIAGQLILEEAGGRLTDFSGARVVSTAVTDVVATNGRVHDELRSLLNRSSSEDG